MSNQPTLTPEQINLIWSDQSDAAKQLRAAKEKGPGAALAELKKQVEAHTAGIEAQEALSVELQKKFKLLRLRHSKLQMAVRFGCQYIWSNKRVEG